MAIVVDNRSRATTSTTGSRRKFNDRFSDARKKAVEKALGETNIDDIGKKEIKGTIPKRDLREPFIHHGKGGLNERVLPGNDKFSTGDRSPRPNGGGGGSGDGEAGEDGGDFEFTMTPEEFVDYLYEDLHLPNMRKRAISDSKKTKPKRGGFTTTGIEQNRHPVRSKIEKMKRLSATTGKTSEAMVALLEDANAILMKYTSYVIKPPNIDYETRAAKAVRLTQANLDLRALAGASVTADEKARLDEIDAELDMLRKRISLVPYYNESTDNKYHGRIDKPVPIAKALMVSEMDISGSMGEETKNSAKLFFFLLHEFLKRNYEEVEMVWIVHHTTAKEVTQEEFFSASENGGTIVSSAHVVLQDVLTRYPETEYNIYVAQASDGDNFESDNPKVSSVMKDILKVVQGFFYVEITQGQHQNLWRTYEKIAEQFGDRFWMSTIQDRQDVAKVFVDFFRKRDDLTHGQAAAFAHQP